MKALNDNPLRTKALTSAVLKALSSYTAQTIGGKRLDFRAILSFALYGLLFDAPLCHYWYDFLGRFTTSLCGKQSSPLLKTAVSTLVDSTVWFPPYLWFYFVVFGLMSGKHKTTESAIKEANTELWPTLIASWKIWPGVTFVNMLILPESLFMPVGNAIGYFWNTYLAMKSLKGGKSKGPAEDVEPKTPAQDSPNKKVHL